MPSRYEGPRAACSRTRESWAVSGPGRDPVSRAAGRTSAGSRPCSPRIIPAGSLEQIIFRVDALHCLEDRGIPVMNSPRALERTVDKFWTTALLEQAGLPVPETIVCERPEDAVAAFRALGDVIVKPLFGSMGLGMVRVTDEEMAFRVRARSRQSGAYIICSAPSIMRGATCGHSSLVTG